MCPITIIMILKCLSFLIFFSLLMRCTHQETVCDIVFPWNVTKAEWTAKGRLGHLPTYLTFNCTLNPINGYTSSDIVFLLTDGGGEYTEVDSSKVGRLDSYTAQLVLETAAISQIGRYVCEARKDGKRSSNETVCESSAPRMKVQVGPREDWLVKDLTCKYLYLRKMSCFWSETAHNIHIRLSEYPFGIKTGYRLSNANPCPRMLQLTKTGQLNSVHKVKCTWEGSAFSQLGAREMYAFGFRYTSYLGEFLYQEFHLRPMTSIVQLDPPTNLMFNYENATLSWGYPELYPEDTLPLMQFRVSVTPFLSDKESSIFLLDNQVTSFKVNQFKPDCDYNFTVSIKVNDRMNAYWSEPASLNWRTRMGNPVIKFRLNKERSVILLTGTIIFILAFLGLVYPVLMAMIAYRRFTHFPNRVILLGYSSLPDAQEPS